MEFPWDSFAAKLIMYHASSGTTILNILQIDEDTW